MQLNPEIHKLQQEVEMLRLKDVQQEHHIQVLTQQLRSSQAQPCQVDIQVSTIHVQTLQPMCSAQQY